MNLILQRFYDNGNETVGKLCEDIAGKHILLCFTLEDQHRDVKVKGDTRIPAGKYTIKLRTVGTKHAQYAKKYPKIHKGMLEISGIPNFEAVMFHIGNTEADTMGCPLVGRQVVIADNGKLTVAESTKAYEKMYPSIASQLVQGHEVWVDVRDEGKQA